MEEQNHPLKNIKKKNLQTIKLILIETDKLLSISTLEKGWVAFAWQNVVNNLCLAVHLNVYFACEATKSAKQLKIRDLCCWRDFK